MSVNWKFEETIDGLCESQIRSSRALSASFKKLHSMANQNTELFLYDEEYIKGRLLTSAIVQELRSHDACAL